MVAVILIAFLILGGAAARAQVVDSGVAAQDACSAEQRREALAVLVQRLESHYVFPDVAKKLVAVLRRKQRDGDYDTCTTRTAFAEALTRDLRSINGDRHLKVWVVPVRAAERSPNGGYDYRPTHGRPANFGFSRVEVLPANIGYVRMSNFSMDEWYDDAREAADAAMRFVRDCDAIVFDLRGNPGGGARLVRYLASYFFAEAGKLLNTYDMRHQNRRVEFRTLREVGGRRMPKAPLAILIDKRTFSAAEAFAYQLKHHDRAIVIGEPSGGGAHGGMSHLLGHRLEAYVPHSRSIHPVTKTDYEGVGVQPDVAAQPWEALRVAQDRLLRRMSAKAEAGQRRRALAAELRDLGAVAQCLRRYLDGGTNRDADRIASAFHEKARMRSIRGGALQDVVARSFFRRVVEPGPAVDRRTRILDIDVRGDVARAEMQLIYPTFGFEDFVHLARVDGRWWIVDKIYRRRGK